jgi:hypothetical protein
MTRLRARTGTTLVEILAALTVAGILAGALTRAIDRAARLHLGTTTMVEQVAQLHESASIIRELTTQLSTGAGDLYTQSPSAITIAGAVGSAVACRQIGAILEVPPEPLISGQRLSFWNTSPQPGDSASWYDEGRFPGTTDDAWRSHEIINASWTPNGCQGTPFVDPRDAGQGGWRLELGGLVATVAPGVPLRMTRPQRIALYRSATSWAIGYAEWDPARGQWQVIQPVTGPLDAATGSPPGLLAIATDSLTAITTNPVDASTLRIDVRSTTAHALRIDGRARGRRAASASTRIAMRNRK